MLRTRMRLVGLMLLAAVLPAAVAAAQTASNTAPPAAPAATETPVTPPAATPAATEPANRPTYPYTGYVNTDLVNLRSGPGLYYYPLAAVGKNAAVVVEGETDGWLAVRPPEGVYGLVKRSDVTMGTDGTTATVSASGARVYASSPSAKRHWSVMSTLQQGDTAKVLGPAEGDLVRIAPPEGARVYVSAPYVTAGATASAGTAAKSIEPAKADPLVEDYKKADAALGEELAKAVPERNYEPSLAAFKTIAEKAERAFLKQAASERVAYLEALQEQQKDYTKLVQLGEHLDERLAEIQAQRATTQAEAEREKRSAKAPFLATGVVAPMESLEGLNYPIKYKLVDDKGHPIVVLKSTTYNLADYVGKAVGVRGMQTYLKDWRIYLVTVDDLEVLE